MRILGLDVGSKTIGVAVSDELGWTAQGLKTIQIQEDKQKSGIPELEKIIREYGIEKIIVGLPKNMNGTIGPRGEISLQFAKLLKNRFSLPVELWDERLTTMAAERILLTADVSRKKRKR